MSRFFHSGDSSSSESSSSTSVEDDYALSERDVSAGDGAIHDSELSTEAHEDVENVGTLETISTRQMSTNSGNRDWLLHSLLEERCINEVRAEYQTLPAHRRPKEAAIKLEGRKRYRNLCLRLAPLDLVSLGPDEDQNTHLRQRVREHLDSVNLNDDPAPQPATPALPVPLRRLLTEGDAASPYSPLDPSSPASFFSVKSGFQQPLSRRYNSDYEELGLLGKGGYGQVYEVRHRLDGQIYAVKKVPVRPALRARIQAGDNEAMTELLSEVRSLAMFNHPNVVRYYNSWLEWSDRFSSQSGSSELLSTTQTDDASDLTDSLHRVQTQSGSEILDNIGFSFESRSQRSIGQDMPATSQQETSITFSHSSAEGNRALVSTTQQVLTLHMQMDIYPMTLADFISPKPANVNGIAPLAHCFHLEPSVSILLAILDGVEYLHAEGVVHRDLKPANIFLRHEANPRAMSGCVDLFLCPSCRADNRAQPAHLSVRIGDFGLVTNIAQTANPSSSPVGTEIYRPTTSKSNVSPRLDIFAVGIMACELLCKFGTQMERRQTLHELRQGNLPKRFSGCTEHVSTKVRECMAYMLSEEAAEDITAAELKRRLKAILEAGAGAERGE